MLLSTHKATFKVIHRRSTQFPKHMLHNQPSFKTHDASAHHISYAYTITMDEGMTNGHSDDGEIAAEKILRMILEQNSIENMLIAV